MSTRGRFIAFEGVDGVGKSTQAERLALGLDAVSTREPGGTALGRGVACVAARSGRARCRSSYRGAAHGSRSRPARRRGGATCPRSRSTRCDGSFHGLVDRVPGLRAEGLDLAEIRRLSQWATKGLQPDLIILLTVSPHLVAERFDTPPDRIEAEDDGFRGRVAKGFLAQAEADPSHWVVVDGDGSPDEVAVDIRRVVVERLGIVVDAEQAPGSPQ